ncbi:hypothetical protein AMK16_15515 [Streptomyces sp. CB00455]|uniref:hypothetical protein n=1 Tax=Streptomyces sp. CB00455 TaxID=1703927 RepID=UPI00093A2DBC|nr:hypothetical protein [Streptomyces sp. CB00455]OKK19502.1 hypothetical protein AMK16_15515 [Streptomyces sp. CB00455]
MEAALIIFALMVLFAFLGLGVYVTAKVVKATRRGVDRTITQARRTVEDTTLRAKSLGQVGVTGALAQLRLDLRTSMRATQEALHQGVRVDASLKESIGLFERLSEHGHELDAELKRLEQEPDRRRTAEILPDLRERAAKITQAADSLRWAARDRARRFAADDLSALSDQIEVESGALRDWTPESVDHLAAAAAAWDAQQQAGGAGQAPAQASAPARGGRGAQPGPAALNGAAPAAQYPWHKARRPESTT